MGLAFRALRIFREALPLALWLSPSATLGDACCSSEPNECPLASFSGFLALCLGVICPLSVVASFASLSLFSLSFFSLCICFPLVGLSPHLFLFYFISMCLHFILWMSTTLLVSVSFSLFLFLSISRQRETETEHSLRVLPGQTLEPESPALCLVPGPGAPSAPPLPT